MGTAGLSVNLRRIKEIDKHASRIEIFNSSLAIMRQGWYISSGGKKVVLPSIEEVMGTAVLYNEPVHLLVDPMYPIHTEVYVENKDCVLAAKDLIDAGYNPAMLNLADLYTPGGLVEYGSGAQEENLCRRSNLILSLYQFSRSRVAQYPDLCLVQHADQYPMDERHGGVYSGVVTFFPEFGIRWFYVVGRAVQYSCHFSGSFEWPSDWGRWTNVAGGDRDYTGQYADYFPDWHYAGARFSGSFRNGLRCFCESACAYCETIPPGN